MDKLKEMLEHDPCYEQHIVSIKEIYEDYLLSMLVPAIYEGIQSLYKRAYDLEQKYIKASKQDPHIINPGVLVIFQTLLKDIPNLNTHKIKNETDRIRASSKSGELFDDLIKAVIKSNIILLTYNVDHKRRSLIDTKYHENVFPHDFVHLCYIYASKNIYGCAELFYHDHEPLIINQNKRSVLKIIRDSIKDAIRQSLPMREILLEYLTQKYEQKDNQYINPYNPVPLNGINGNNGINPDEYAIANDLVNRDIGKYNNYNLLEADDDDDNDDYETSNNDSNGNSEKTESGYDSSSNNNPDNSSVQEKSNLSHSNQSNSGTKTDKQIDDGFAEIKNSQNKMSALLSDSPKNNKQNNELIINKSNSLNGKSGVKMIDLSSTLSKKGKASSYFNEIMPDVNKRFDEYKKTTLNNSTNQSNQSNQTNQTNNLTNQQKDNKNDKDVVNKVNDILK